MLRVPCEVQGLIVRKNGEDGATESSLDSGVEERRKVELFAYGRFSRASTVVFWLTSVIGLSLSAMSVLDVCTSACSEASRYSIFGVRFGWFGILFFAAVFTALILQYRFVWARQLFIFLIYSAAGAEIRFIWLQKYVIESWCPLCLAIAFVVFLALVFIVWENLKPFRSETEKMKRFLKHSAAMIFIMVAGLTSAIVGVKGQAEAQEPNLFLGKADSTTVVYFVSDWFCPACRRTEPTIDKIYPKVAEIAKVAFVDIPVHPETSNFTPYNLQFLVYEKDKYIQLRKALAGLAEKTADPSRDEVQSAVAPYGVKLRDMSYADILSGLKWNENVSRTFGIRATPTVVVSNTKTGRHINLVGQNEISYEEILKAINEVGK
jgi:protein-disulfide isomerase/uncharacterized membrane protein